MAENWNDRRFMLTGFLTLLILVFGIGGWSAWSSINGAVVTSGQVEVETKRQVVQHQNGGVVGQLFVDDGDKVEAGQPLLRLDDRLDRSELSVIEGQLFSLLGIKARIEAEQVESEEIVFDPELLERARTHPEEARIVSGQKELLKARRETREKQVGQFRERQTQTRNQIIGLEARSRALEQQLKLLDDELTDQNKLLKGGLTQRSRVLALQREVAQITGNLSEVQSSIAQARAGIAEMELAILNVSSQMREQSITTMPDTEAKIAELRERRNAKLEILSRMDVRAPVSGVVFGLQVHALRSVIRPAEPILYIIPQNVELVISTRIPPAQIDQVHVGQDVRLHFANFDRRSTPELNGSVQLVSADVATDEKTGQSFYTAQVVPKPGEMAKLGSNVVIPGMPVDAFIQTQQRSPLEYLVQPLAHYFDKAFRER